MEAIPFSRKDFFKRKGWITVYENLNVDIGLECGLSGCEQPNGYTEPLLHAARLKVKGRN